MIIENIGSNRTEVTTSRYKILVSYKTVVAALDYKEKVFYKTDRFWSVTTSRHINLWINENKQGVYTDYHIIELDQSILDDLIE